MKITVRYFASIREGLSQSMEVRQTQAKTLGGLRDELLALGGEYAQLLSRAKAVRMALNQVMADEQVALREGDEVAFFPPVTGG